MVLLGIIMKTKVIKALLKRYNLYRKKGIDLARHGDRSRWRGAGVHGDEFKGAKRERAKIRKKYERQGAMMRESEKYHQKADVISRGVERRTATKKKLGVFFGGPRSSKYLRKYPD